jgi:hypothetical protein
MIDKAGHYFSFAIAFTSTRKRWDQVAFMDQPVPMQKY